LTLRQRLQFFVDAIEVDIDERGKMVMIWGLLIEQLMA
jgi:hypothetical protein